MKHKHLIVRAEVSNPPIYEQTITDWASNLIRDIGMKIMMGPYVKYCDMEGNKGFTCVTIIETSHVAIHIWDEQSPKLIQLDVYTCGELDTQIAKPHQTLHSPIFYHTEPAPQRKFPAIRPARG